MKRVLLCILVFVAFASCTPNIYYQMYQTKPISDVAINQNYIVYEDEHCKILYDFWKEHGEIGFVFYNKTSENIYLHLDECFFVENNIAYDYYGNRIWSSNKTVVNSKQLSNSYGSSTTNTNASASAGYYQVGGLGMGNASGSSVTYKNGSVYSYANAVINSASNSVSVAEKNVICVPPQTGKIVTEYVIVTAPYRSCDLYRNPKKKDPHSVTFDKEHSPFVFGNRIAFSIGESEVLVRVNNDFYVSMISNYPEQDIIDTKSSELCGKKDGGQIKVFKESGPDQFYIKYTLTGSMLEGRY